VSRRSLKQKPRLLLEVDGTTEILYWSTTVTINHKKKKKNRPIDDFLR